MTGVVPSDLRAAADQVHHAALEIANALESGPEIDRPLRHTSMSELTSLSRLQDLIVAAHAQLDTVRAHREQAERFGPDAWPRRRSELIETFAADPVDGTRARLEAWCVAAASGEWDEAERLAGRDLPIDGPASWLPDRLRSAVGALRGAAPNPRQALSRLSDLFEVVARPPADDPTLEIAPVHRLALLALEARLAARAGDSSAASRLALGFETVIAGADTADPRTVLDILTTLSILERHGVPPVNRDPDHWWGTYSLPSSSSSPADWDYMLASGAAEDVGCAAELLRRRESSDDIVTRLAEARRVVRSIANVAGAFGRLASTLEPPPDVLVLALAERLMSEDCLREADRMLSLFAADSGPMRVEAAEIALRIARATGDIRRLPTALLDCGDVALSNGDYIAAAAHYREVLATGADKPAKAEAMRSLADALVVMADNDSADEAAAKCRQAIEFCDRSEELEPLTPANSWFLKVRGNARRRLATECPEEHSEHTWGLLSDAAQSAAQRSDDGLRWSTLWDALSEVGALRAGLVAARRAAELRPGDYEMLCGWAVAAIMADRLEEYDTAMQQARAAAEDADGPDLRLVWLDAAAAHLREEWPLAIELTQRVLSEQPDLVYVRQRYALLLARSGQAEAAEREWNTVWNQAGLDTYEGLTASLNAAMHLNLLDSARELASRKIRADGSASPDADGLFASGLLDLRDGASDDRLRNAINRPHIEMQLRDNCADWMLAPLLRGDGERHLPVINALVEQRIARIRDAFPENRDLASLADVELAEVGRRVSDEPAAVRALADVRTAFAAEIDPAPSAAPVSEMPTIRVLLPSETILSGPSQGADHPLLTVWMPDARWTYDTDAPPVVFQVDDDLQGPQVAIVMPNGYIDLSEVPRDRWYLPEQLASAMAPVLPVPGHPSDVQPGLSEFVAPDDALGRLRMWSPDEVIARRIIRVWASHRGDPEAAVGNA